MSMVFYSYHIYLIKQLFDFVNTSSKTNSSAGTSRGCTTHHGSDHAHINPRDHAYVANRIFMIYIPIQVRPHLIPEQMWALLYIELALVLEDEDDWALGTGHVANWRTIGSLRSRSMLIFSSSGSGSGVDNSRQEPEAISATGG